MYMSKFSTGMLIVKAYRWKGLAVYYISSGLSTFSDA